MVKRTESEGKPEGLIWTAGFVFCLCFNSEPAGGGRAGSTGWEKENVCPLLFQYPAVDSQTRNTTAFSWRAGRSIQANSRPSGCSYPWLGPCCQLTPFLLASPRACPRMKTLMNSPLKNRQKQIFLVEESRQIFKEIWFVCCLALQP